MVENGFVHAVTKSMEKEKRKAIKKQVNYEVVCELFKKYGVDYTTKFSIEKWTKTDVLKLAKCQDYPIPTVTMNDNRKLMFFSDNSYVEIA